MNTLLFIDTETTGKIDRYLPPTDDRQPHMVQLAAMLTDETGKRLAQFVTLIEPMGWAIPDEASRVHGITTDDCQRYGMPIYAAINTLNYLTANASRIIAHNMDFDSLVIRGTARYMLMPMPPVTLKDRMADTYCTMKAATDVVRIPSPYRAGQFKWPSLAEAYKHFTGKELSGAHDAMVDVEACAAVYLAMNQRKVAEPQPV
jgi:DNA polymerase-3 subunit epsilon